MTKLSQAAFSAYIAVKTFILNLKNDERGLSGVVVAILLILVAVLAVALLWALLGQTILDWWEQLIGEAVDDGFDPITP
ncbi:MAG: hypothetical protein FWH24_03360 [Oscillospiraceae bacterium]|nr:hypothetical protein [Oscillospiraceae bacterium]